MRSILAGALGAVLLTGSAFADLVAVSTWNSSAAGGAEDAAVLPGSATTELDAVDGQVVAVFDPFVPNAVPGTVNLRVDFVGTTGGENTFKIHLAGTGGLGAAVGTLTLVEARYFDKTAPVPPAGPTVYYSSGVINQGLTLGQNTIGGGFAAVGGPSFGGNSINAIYLLFSISDGGRAYIDQIGNPEPGTMALMGLGLLGLGGVVVRRRAAKKSKS